MEHGKSHSRGSLWLVAVLACAAGVAAAEPEQFQGTYRFEDGSCVTGGRFDESGRQRLLLMDTGENKRGGLFEANGPDFQSVMDPTSRARFDEHGGHLSWITSAGVEQAQLIHSPRTRAAEIDSDGVMLAATLYLPAAGAADVRYPGIVLAHGSGPQNRHAGPWTSFFVDQGFAVLAYDKRGVGESTGDFKGSDYADMAKDLAAAVRWLAARADVDGQRVGVHATSQSGWYAPAVLGEAPVAFLIVRAGPPLPTGPTTLHERTEEWRTEGLPEDAIVGAAGFWQALMEAAALDRPQGHAQALLDVARTQPWFATAYGDWKEIRAPWWRQQQVNARYRPALDLARHPVPTLWLLADRDENVPYAASVAALVEAGLPADMLTVATVTGASHGFFVAAGDDGGVRYTDEYWPVMAAWLRARALDGPATPAAQCRGMAAGN
jgi:uncharacterized protein